MIYHGQYKQFHRDTYDKKNLGCAEKSQDDQVAEDAGLELYPHFRLHRRRADQPLDPQPRGRQLRHLAVERRTNLEVQLEVVVGSAVDGLRVQVVHGLLPSLVVNLRKQPVASVTGNCQLGSTDARKNFLRGDSSRRRGWGGWGFTRVIEFGLGERAARRLHLYRRFWQPCEHGTPAKGGHFPSRRLGKFRLMVV